MKRRGLFWVFFAAPFLFAVILAGGLSYVAYQHNLAQQAANEKSLSDLRGEVLALSESVEATTELIRQELVRLGESLSSTQSENSELLGKLSDEQKKLKQVSSTVGTLEKLSKTDPELLQKYSKVFFLNEHYAPPRLTAIDAKYVYSENQVHKIHASVYPHLREMLDDAKSGGIELYVKSAFRSFNEQTAIKSNYTVTYGAGTANQFSADQGYSEHQLGTTVDLITTGLGGALDLNFATTPAYQWLLDNAHKYGFILSYPQNNTYYMYEPWHWRYVGVELAADLHKKGTNFYDMDQRDIDEYLVNIFD